ncbi:hypothetical protein TNCV_1850061 [Trichonephila clavipes]|nr:hypothetical protein TNCV_1850061 [Trichonephila clavipes]
MSTKKSGNCHLGAPIEVILQRNHVDTKYEPIVDRLLRPSRKKKWGSPKKSIHFYSPLVHWANHVPSSGSRPMLTSKGTRWPIPMPTKSELQPTSSTTVYY